MTRRPAAARARRAVAVLLTRAAPCDTVGAHPTAPATGPYPVITAKAAPLRWAGAAADKETTQ